MTVRKKVSWTSQSTSCHVTVTASSKIIAIDRIKLNQTALFPALPSRFTAAWSPPIWVYLVANKSSALAPIHAICPGPMVLVSNPIFDTRANGSNLDASKFGQSYLSKFGWDASKGLGAEGDGMKTHLKVSQKLDLMGIGAQHTKDPNGIAWKQNKDFESVLRRLNAAVEGSGDDLEAEQAKEALGGAFISSTAKEEDVEMTEKEKRKLEKKEKKRKRAEAEEGGEAQKEAKKAKTDDVPIPAPEPAPRERVLPRHRAYVIYWPFYC